jgi:quinol monooxygenase YgiN
MYGTIAKYRVKAGREAAVASEFDALTASPPEGWVATTVFRSVDNPREVWIAAVFESEDAYKRNAASPEMDSRYQALMEHLEAEPEWHDGHVVRHLAKSGAAV